MDGVGQVQLLDVVAFRFVAEFYRGHRVRFSVLFKRGRHIDGCRAVVSGNVLNIDCAVRLEITGIGDAFLSDFDAFCIEILCVRYVNKRAFCSV